MKGGNKMNRFLKTCIVGGAIYGSLAFGFMLGKGHMLGVLAGLDMNPNDGIDVLANDEDLYLRAVSYIAKEYKEKNRLWLNT